MASSAVAVEERRMSIARVFERGFATIGSNPVTMFGIAFLFSALPGTLITYGAEFVQQPMLEDLGVGATIVIWIATVLLAIIFGMITQGALVRATIAYSEGRKASFGESIMAGLVVVLPLIGLGILLSLAVGLGMVLLFVPGVMLYIMWSVASPALVAEREGVFAAFSRSRFLTSGARWKIFAMQLVIIVISTMVSSGLGVMLLAFNGTEGMAAMGQSLPLWYLAVNVVIQTIVAAIWGALQTALYVELRDWKDGPDTQALADIFA
jgi:hypothetical protein